MKAKNIGDSVIRACTNQEVSGVNVGSDAAALIAAILETIARADDYGDSYITRPIRDALAKRRTVVPGTVPEKESGK